MVGAGFTSIKMGGCTIGEVQGGGPGIVTLMRFTVKSAVRAAVLRVAVPEVFSKIVCVGPPLIL
jgi:hypothetical protein